LKADTSVTDDLSNKITANDSDITVEQGRVTTLQGTVSSLNSDVNSSLALKADTSVTDDLSNRITANDSDITVEQGRVTTLTATVSTVNSDLTASLALKADTSVTDDLFNRVDATDSDISVEQGRVTNLSTDLSDLNSDTTAALALKASSTVTESLQNQVTATNSDLTIERGRITELSGDVSGLDSDLDVETEARQALASTILLDSDVTVITNSLISTFRTDVGLGETNTVSSVVQSEISELTIIDSEGIATIAQSELTTFETKLLDSTGAVGSIATVQSGLLQSVSANSDALSAINQKYFVALDDGNTFTGFEVINGDSVSSFTIQANDFALKTQNQTMTPFSVSGDVVSLTNTKVTGDLDVGTGAANSMRLTDDVLKIHDSDGNVRVIIGNLSL
jgi:hypothetical protein